MDFRRQRILSAMVCGFELEMYSDLSRKEIAKSLGAAVKKRIEVRGEYHSRLDVTADVWKIESDYSGGLKMHEVVTGPMEYYEAIAVLGKILGWMRQNAWTDEKCAFHANISFDEKKIKLGEPLENVNRLKFVLGFDEDYVYERFPKRKNSIYARSINSIFPINKFVFSDDVSHVYSENYELPGDKNYGINFSKLTKKYLEVRYCGGRAYERKFREIVEIVDYMGTFTFDVLSNNRSYTEAEVAKLKMAMREHKKVVQSFSDLGSFFVNYPAITLTVDLRGDEQVLKTFYPELRERIFDLIIRCDMRSGFINFDADVSKFQIKDSFIRRAFPLENVEIFDSKIIGGNVMGCDLFRCEVSNAHVLDCRLWGGNTVKNSKIVNSPIVFSNEIVNCYIDARDHVISGEVKGGIIRSGEIGSQAEISQETEIVGRGTDVRDKKDKKDKDFSVNGGVGFDWRNSLIKDEKGKKGGKKDAQPQDLNQPGSFGVGDGKYGRQKIKPMPKTKPAFSWKKDVDPNRK